MHPRLGCIEGFDTGVEDWDAWTARSADFFFDWGARLGCLGVRPNFLHGGGMFLYPDKYSIVNILQGGITGGQMFGIHWQKFLQGGITGWQPNFRGFGKILQGGITGGQRMLENEIHRGGRA